MKLDLRPLLAGDRLLTFDYELSLDAERDDPTSFLHGVSFPSPMKVKGQITNASGYMVMTLTLSLDFSASCARCLRPVCDTFTLDLEKTVATRDQLQDVDEFRLTDYAIIEGGFLDMDEQLYEQLEMEFPIRFLCSDDCKGLCQRCGKNLNEGACDCKTKEIDPRLAPLADILAKLKEEENKK